MKVIKIIGQIIGQFIMSFISVLVIYLTIIAWGSIIPSSCLEQSDDLEIFIQTNGVHTDVCMPVKSDCFDWTSFVDTSFYRLNDTYEYIAIGWGDKGFFLDTPTWAELKASTALNAIFLPSPCAMHVEYKEVKPAVSETVKSAKLSSSNYLNLVDYIRNSFVLKENHPIYIDGFSYWGNDHFFEANGNYHMLNTCNSWTNGALKSAGLKTASFAAFPGVIMSYR
jgi:uncharacterized protein (TIGR02117 family)